MIAVLGAACQSVTRATAQSGRNWNLLQVNIIVIYRWTLYGKCARSVVSTCWRLINPKRPFWIYAICMMASFYYYDQNPPGFAFLYNERFCNLHLAVITKIKHERKNDKDSGHSGKMTSSCNWPVEVRIAHIKGTTQTYLIFFFLSLFCKLSIIFFSVTMKIRSYSIPISGLFSLFHQKNSSLWTQQISLLNDCKQLRY